MEVTVYGYRCPQCRQTYTSEVRGDRLDVVCHVCVHPRLHRDYSGIAVNRPMAEHWNSTVNMPIRSEAHFREELKVLSEANSLYTGVEQRLEILDPEQAKQGVTEEGLDATNRVRVASGRPPIKLY